VDHLPPPATGLEGVHGAEDAAADDDHPLRVHGAIVATGGGGTGRADTARGRVRTVVGREAVTGVSRVG
jgi:hypothetical protein